MSHSLHKFIFKSFNLFKVNELEDYRTDRLNELATLVQKIWRGWVQRKFFLQLVCSQQIISRNYKCWKVSIKFFTKLQYIILIQCCDWFDKSWFLLRILSFEQRKRYLLWLRKRLPSHSPLSRDWPPAPSTLQQTSYLLRKMYHKWRVCQLLLKVLKFVIITILIFRFEYQ